MRRNPLVPIRAHFPFRGQLHLGSQRLELRAGTLQSHAFGPSAYLHDFLPGLFLGETISLVASPIPTAVLRLGECFPVRHGTGITIELEWAAAQNESNI